MSRRGRNKGTGSLDDCQFKAFGASGAVVRHLGPVATGRYASAGVPLRAEQPESVLRLRRQQKRLGRVLSDDV